jgi:hypothetical protein
MHNIEKHTKRSHDGIVRVLVLDFSLLVLVLVCGALLPVLGQHFSGIGSEKETIIMQYYQFCE